MNRDELKPEDIKIGKWYRAKRFKEGLFGSTNNDRLVVWISIDRKDVQYDSDTVRIGQRRPVISMEKFMKWVKEKCPEGNPI